jgi:Fur family transcriptional regulator, ferric uptake regulator
MELHVRASSVDQIILETLAKEHSHLTSHQVYEQIRGRLPAVNPSTVYRALERLVKNGKISVADIGSGAAVYESLTEEVHHHLVCQKCGYVDTIGHAEVSQFFDAVQNKKQFEVVTNHLILFGLCAGCRQEPNGE